MGDLVSRGLYSTLNVRMYKPSGVGAKLYVDLGRQRIIYFYYILQYQHTIEIFVLVIVKLYFSYRAIS